MRRSLAAFSLVALAACAGRAIPTPEALDGLADQRGYPLEAWLERTRTSDLAFSVNQEAYVSIFYIAPGQGVEMLYPSYRDELDRADAGYNVPGFRFTSGQWYFVNTSFNWWTTASSPTYLLLVASKQPLRVERYERFPGLLRRTLGLQTFASYDAYDVIDALTQLVVAPQPDEDWVTDLIVLWPEMRSRYASRYYSAFGSGSPITRFVSCTNGRILVVPWDYPYSGCPFYSTYERDPDQPTPSTPPVTEPTDSASVPPVAERPGGRPVRPDSSATGKQGRDGIGRRVREPAEEPVRRSVGERLAHDAMPTMARRERLAYPEAPDDAGRRAFTPRGRAVTEPGFTPHRWSGGRSASSHPARERAPSPRTERSSSRAGKPAPRAERPAPAPRPAASERPSRPVESNSSERARPEKP